MYRGERVLYGTYTFQESGKHGGDKVCEPYFNFSSTTCMYSVEGGERVLYRVAKDTNLII